MAGKLYLVATPIGNLKDVTVRAVETLRAVDVIACEDTRHSKKLLNHLGITNRLISYHEHNEGTRTPELIDRIMNGESVALVSDAGTPGINDPGYRIVQAAIASDIVVIPIPGPSALVAAITASGLATDAIFFGGFLPAKKNERRSRLRQISDVPASLVFYESPRRLKAALVDCLEELGDRQAVVARELTKMYEEFLRGRLSDLVARLEAAEILGEIVIMIERANEENMLKRERSPLTDRVSELVSSGIDRKAALKQAAREFGLSRSEAYRVLQSAKNL